MKKLLILTAAVLLACAVNAPAQILVSFDSAGGAGSTNYVGAAAIGGPTDIWNAATFGGTTSGGVTSTGGSTSITLTDASLGNYNAGQGPNGTAAGFFNPYFYAGSAATVTDTLNDVPAGTYNLYLYGQNGYQYNAGNSLTGTTFTVGATSLSTANSPSGGGGFGNGVNWVEFTGITLNAPGSISFSYVANQDIIGSAHVEGDFNGLQLQSIAVPEPSTNLLMGVGCLVLFAILRRKSLHIG